MILLQSNYRYRYLRLQLHLYLHKSNEYSHKYIIINGINTLSFIIQDTIHQNEQNQ